MCLGIVGILLSFILIEIHVAERSSSYCYIANYSKTYWLKTMILLCSQIQWAKNAERAQWGQLISLPGYTAPNLGRLEGWRWLDSWNLLEAFPFPCLEWMQTVDWKLRWAVRQIAYVWLLHVFSPCGLSGFLTMWQLVPRASIPRDRK